MLYNLKELYQCLVGDEKYLPNQTLDRVMTGSQIALHADRFTNWVGHVNMHVAKMILLGYRLPRIYGHEQNDGHIKIVYGADIFNTIVSINGMDDKLWQEQVRLSEKFLSVEIEMTVFSDKMTEEQVNFIIQSFKNFR